MAKILLVDDAWTVRTICRRVCAAIGFETFEAGNGQVALDIVRQQPDLNMILLDGHMPVMDGLTFLRTLRGDNTLAQPRVVMCTSDNDVADIAVALELGADGYIMKPFTESMIRDRILDACAARRRS